MKRTVWGLFIVLATLTSSGGAFAEEAQTAPAGEIIDNRDASFLPPPAALLPVKTETEKKDEATPAPEAVAEPEKKSAEKTDQPKKEEKTEAKPLPAAAPAAKEVTPAPREPAKSPEPKPADLKAPPESLKTPPAAVAPTPEKKVSAAPPAAKTPVQTEVVAVPANQVAPVFTPPDPEPVIIPPPVASTPLPDVDPETMGLLSPSNGGLGATLWKETSRRLVDRLMPTIGLPTISPTLNGLAKRMFLTVATPPYLEGGKPQRSLLAQRSEALMALGAVSDAWKLASLAEAKLVDPVTLRLMTEAALIGPDSKEVCDKIPSMMTAHGKTVETGVEWQKSLLLCQLRAGDAKAVQLGLDLMREQPARDEIFLSLMNKNVLGGNKQLPRQLTPLRPLNLAVLRQLGLPLPSELYARAEASMIPELLLAKAADEKARLALAEKAAAKGILTTTQLADTYRSAAFTAEEIASAFTGSENNPRTRAMAYQASLHEQAAPKRVELAQRVFAGLEPSVLSGAQGQLVASILETIPVSAEHAASAVMSSRIFVLAGRPDKAMGWLKLARDSISQSPETARALSQSWPLFALSGLVSDGEYAQGFKAWIDSQMASPSDDGNVMHAKRERAGQVLLVLNAAGFAVTEEAWLAVIEGVPPVKQMTSSPVLLERMRQAAAAGRKGETILLSLLMAGPAVGDASFGLLVEIVRALRLVGLTAESQALAREILVGLGSV